MSKRKLYVGCALQGAPDDSIDLVKMLRDRLEEHFEVLKFLFPHPGTDEDVYTLDIRQHVADCHFMLAVSDHPSTGLGYEMGVLVEKYQKPLLICSRAVSGVSRLVRGSTRNAYVQIKEYANVEHLILLTLAFEKEMFVDRRPPFRLHDSAEDAGFKLHKE